MKKLLFIFALVPFIVNGQTPEPLVDLSKYHDFNRLFEMADLNFTNITEGGYQIPAITADAITVTALTSTTAVIDSIDVRAIDADTINVDILRTPFAEITVLDYDPPHGALNFADSTTVIALTQNTWTKVTGPAGDLFIVRDQDDMTIAGDSITIEVDGDYMTWISFSFDGVQNAVFHIAIYKNGAVTDWEMHRKTSAQDTGNAGMPAYLKDLVAGDDLSIWICILIDL